MLETYMLTTRGLRPRLSLHVYLVQTTPPDYHYLGSLEKDCHGTTRASHQRGVTGKTSHGGIALATSSLGVAERHLLNRYRTALRSDCRRFRSRRNSNMVSPARCLSGSDYSVFVGNYRGRQSSGLPHYHRSFRCVC